jgi:response regulator of citrate/malate metabolism
MLSATSMESPWISSRFGAGRATSLVVSRDAALAELVRRACPAPWAVEICRDWRRVGEIVGTYDVRLIVFDDDAVPEANRSELIDGIHVWSPQVLIVYVAGNHSEAVERSARAGGVLCYTSKPIDAERLEHLLRSLDRST